MQDLIFEKRLRLKGTRTQTALTNLSAFVTEYANDADWDELSTDTAEGTSTKCKDKRNILLPTHLNNVVQRIVKSSCLATTKQECQSQHVYQ